LPRRTIKGLARLDAAPPPRERFRGVPERGGCGSTGLGVRAWLRRRLKMTPAAASVRFRAADICGMANMASLPAGRAAKVQPGRKVPRKKSFRSETISTPVVSSMARYCMPAKLPPGGQGQCRLAHAGKSSRPDFSAVGRDSDRANPESCERWFRICAVPWPTVGPEAWPLQSVAKTRRHVFGEYGDFPVLRNAVGQGARRHLGILGGGRRLGLDQAAFRLRPPFRIGLKPT